MWDGNQSRREDNEDTMTNFKKEVKIKASKGTNGLHVEGLGQNFKKWTTFRKHVDRYYVV